MTPFYQRAGITIYHGDNRDALAALEPGSIAAVVTDPPYGLTSGDRRSARRASPNPRQREAAGGFMGMKWDGSGIELDVDFWRLVAGVMVPGAHLAAFGGSRTFHRIAVAIEDAGLELRDTLAWLYGSGFPKSHDVSKAIDKMAGAEREVIGRDDIKARQQTGKAGTPSYGDFAGNAGAITAPATDAARDWQGWGTALKPAYEPIILARAPLAGTVAANVLKCGAGALNIDACRIGTGEDRTGGGPRVSAPGWGWSATSERPEGGRWPANVVLDEVAAGMLDEQSGERPSRPGNTKKTGGGGYEGGWRRRDYSPMYPGDTGGASRFFYCAKASKRERNAGLDGLPERSASDRYPTLNSLNIKHQQRLPAQNHHPTVKPLALMRWLVTLVTPPGGTVLDMFAGSGTTGVVCAELGIPAVLMDAEEAYCEIAARRIDHALDRADEAGDRPAQLSLTGD